MARAHGRASSKVSSDIGATSPGRWQTWHFAWRIGATSLVNVTACDTGGAGACAAEVPIAPVIRPRARRLLVIMNDEGRETVMGTPAMTCYRAAGLTATSTYPLVQQQPVVSAVPARRRRR